LYNVQTDPADMDNVIDQHPDIARKLKEQLNKIVGPDAAKPRKPASDDEDAAPSAAKMLKNGTK